LVLFKSKKKEGRTEEVWLFFIDYNLNFKHFLNFKT